MLRVRCFGSGPKILAERSNLPNIWEFPKIRGTLVWRPCNKDPTTQGTILGSPIFGNSHIELRTPALRRGLGPILKHQENLSPKTLSTLKPYSPKSESPGWVFELGVNRTMVLTKMATSV